MLGFLIAMSVTMALIPPLMRAAQRFHFLDDPGERKVHAQPVPRVGGIAMAAGVLLALAFSGEFAQPMPAFLAGVVVLLAFGVWDDRVTLSAGPKLAGQIIAVLIVMIRGDVSIDTLTLTERHPLGPWLSAPLTFVFLLGVTNAINLADGLDGLAGGTTLLSLSALALLALSSNTPFVGVVAIIIIGAILGFLRFNTHPARVFMGDSGSQILGFSGAVLAVVLTQNQAAPLSSALPLLLLGIPIIDTLMVMTQRMLEGRSPFHADRNHIHHRLLTLGLDHHEAVVTIYLLQSCLFVTAWFLRYESDLFIAVVFGVFAALSIALLKAAARAGWRWRHATAGGAPNVSRVGRAVHWLRMPQHLPRYALMTSASCVTLYFLTVAHACPSPSIDVRWTAALLALCLCGALIVRWRSVEASRIDKIALYTATVMAVYFDRESATLLDAHAVATALVFVMLVLAIIVRVRLTSDRRFRVTPLDVLIIVVAVAIPNLPGSIATSATLGESIAKLIALLYGVETLLGAAARWWRVPSLAALVFLVACALRGLT